VLRDDMKLLDYNTGGGEFLLSLHHPYGNTRGDGGVSAECGVLPQKAVAFGD